jgi:ornithine--oxo-acid transaminase
MNTKEIIELENQLGAKNYHPLNVVIEKGKGIWIWDAEGKKYMDCLSAYSAVNQSHCHPIILKKMNEQMEKLTITLRAFRNNQLSLFFTRICAS